MSELLVEENTQDTTVVTRVVSHPIKQVWAALLTPAGQAALLGDGGALGDKGDRWQAADGTFGMTRSYHPMEEIRFSWHARDDAPRTWVDVRFEKIDDTSTRLEIVHDHRGAEIDVPQVRAHWEAALDRIANDAL
ncbi:MAG: SRPBCC domain-containing protein [Propionibacteriaceae bacterium]|jgi:uncharacterized protein YndB with AHSA1/START domain|nr:SRPBCC domain-containing protein [Propionibacteriaceae bacterium]